jgi:hypothetical protein
MANIIQRITLEGAEAIRAQLRAIGATGKDAFDKLGDVRRLNDSLSQADVHLNRLATSLKTFGANAQTAGQAGVAFGNAVGSSLTRLTVIAGGLGLAFGKIAAQFQKVGAEAEELDQNAAAAGLTTKAYEALTNALGQNGVGSSEAAKGLDRTAKFLVAAKDEADAYQKGLAKLNKENRAGKLSFQEYQEKLNDLNDGMGKGAQLVQRYGLKLTDASGELKNVRDFSIEFGEALNRSDDATRKAADALLVFGRAGRKIGQAFGQGREAIEALELRAQALAPSLTASAQKAVTGMDDAFDQLGQTGKSLTREIVSIFAPAVTAGVSAFTEALARNRFIFLELAETIDRQVRPALVAAMVQLADPQFSVTLKNAFQVIINSVKAVATAVRTIIIPAIFGIIAVANQAAAAVNRIFGTELTGGALLAAIAIAKVTGLLTVFTTGITFAVSAVRLLVSALPVLIAGLRILSAVLVANPVIALGVAIGILVGLILRQFPSVRDAIFNFLQSPLEGVKIAWNGLVVFFQTTVQNIITIFNALVEFFTTLWTGITTGAQGLWDGIVAAAQVAVDFVVEVWTTLTQFFTDLWAGITAVFTTAWEAVKAGAQALWDFITSSAAAPFKAIENAVSAMYNFVIDKFNALIDKVKEFIGLQASAGSGGGGDGAQSNAAGGYIRGRGTGTSDSILSWLSNGEFVVKARAVQHYGPQLLHALNNMRLPKFAAGGAVTAAQNLFVPSIPRFASGGPVLSGASAGGAGRPMVLQIGDQTFSGLTANGNAVEALQRAAAQKSVRSAGRKPIWFKG